MNQIRLLQVLRRLKVPTSILQVIANTYQDPQFQICADGSFSETRSHKSGIRPGCALSPYLFTLLMSAMFTDIETKLNTPNQLEPISGMKFAETLSADDTFLFGTHAHPYDK